jgi:hypothetical protein
MHTDVLCQSCLRNLMFHKKPSEINAWMKGGFQHLFASMIINNLNIKCVAITPDKADPISIVDAYTHLTLPVSFELLNPQTWPRCEIVQTRCRIEKYKRFECRRMQGAGQRSSGSFGGTLIGNVRSSAISEASDRHDNRFYRLPVKRQVRGRCYFPWKKDSVNAFGVATSARPGPRSTTTRPRRIP